MNSTISWFGFGLTVIAVYLLARRKRRAWEAGVLSNLCWIAYGWNTKQLPIILSNLVLVVLNGYGWWQWRHNEP